MDRHTRQVIARRDAAAASDAVVARAFLAKQRREAQAVTDRRDAAAAQHRDGR
jgi:hypothetical protein